MATNEIVAIIAGFILWSIGGIIILLALANHIEWLDKTEGFEFVNPVYVYKNVKVNYFGAAMVALGLALCCPLGAFGYWFYKLCTVGRK